MNEPKGSDAIEKDPASQSQILATGWRHPAFITIFLAGFLAGLAVRTMTIALPVIIIEFSVPLAVASWVSNVYYIVLASFIITFGIIADARGLRKIFLWGMVVFAVASVLCSLAVDIYTLIGARMIQALGSSMFIAASPALIVHLAPEEHQGQVQGISAASVAAGAVVGWALGGIFIDIAGWRSVFVPVIFLAVAVFFLGRKYLPEFTGKSRDTLLDIPGAILFFVFLSSFTAVLSVIEVPGLNILYVAGLLAVAAVSGPLLFLHHRRKQVRLKSDNPGKSRNFYLALSSSVLIFLVYSGVCFVLPFVLILGLDLDPAGAGLLLMGITVIEIIIAPAAGLAADRYGPRTLCLGAIVVIVLTTSIFSFLRHGMGLEAVILLIFFWGAIGTFLGPIMNLLFRHCGSSSRGSCSGIIMTSRYLGFILGIALFTIVFSESVYASGLPRNELPVLSRLTPAVQVVGFVDTFLFAAAVAMVALVLMLMVPGDHRVAHGDEHEEKKVN